MLILAPGEAPGCSWVRHAAVSAGNQPEARPPLNAQSEAWGELGVPRFDLKTLRGCPLWSERERLSAAWEGVFGDETSIDDGELAERSAAAVLNCILTGPRMFAWMVVYLRARPAWMASPGQYDESTLKLACPTF
ncbi:hypothetical protein NDU88_003378 [Pleurodeles waltl]|uniref:Uncharacterized protein n=1 Tax=Pleurodeles waltl TaxID=8319 RepID=A0AAV7W3C6_PLEWA|nr:hypothetical protein NDU88_003378 [Pleurodeles waltl]